MDWVPEERAEKPSRCHREQELDYLIAGKILSPWGIKGELKVELMTDFPDRYVPGREVYVKGEPFHIEASRWHKGFRLIKLAEVNSLQDAETLRGQFLEIPRADAAALEEDQFYYFQIVGLKVFTTKGRYLGEVVDIISTGSNDVWVVQGEKSQVLIPAIEDVVQRVDLPERKAIVEEIEGLL